MESIDVLVCNAGTNVRNRSLESLDPADWDRMIATNLTGSFNLVHYVLPSMRRRKNGLVIQICSVSGIRASTLGGVGYSASKFGQSALGICLGREEGAHGIRSSVIYPGEVETPILDARPVPVGAERRSVILQPDDVAAAVKFLVELHPRAHVPELVITPTVDDTFDRRQAQELAGQLASAGTPRHDIKWLSGPVRLIHLAGLDLAARELVELGIKQVAEQFALGLKLVRRARVFDAAVLQDDHMVARSKGRQADGAG